MESFWTRLERRAQQSGSLLCVGLDPHLEFLEEDSAAAAQAFCLEMIEACHEQALVFKPNAAFFEVWGAAGWAALSQVIAACQAVGVPVLLDAKRGDIASTAAAYARACFESLGADAVTLSPYLGEDSLEPFEAHRDRGVFVLCKTSNAGASDLQDLRLEDGSRLFEQVARKAAGSRRGLVVGATQLEAMAKIRQLAPNSWILAPGIGAQGGDLDAALVAGLRADGLGMLINSSRGLARADDPAQAARQLNARIQAARERPGRQESVAPGAQALQVELTLALLEKECVRFGEFTLKSGLRSPIYIDLRRLVGFPRLMQTVAAAFDGLLDGLEYDVLAALPYAALPIGQAISLHRGEPLIYPRREVKEYGTRAAVEGVFAPGQRAVVIDDLATTGGSKIEGIEKLQAVDLRVEDVVVLIDRASGAAELMAEHGLGFHAVLDLEQLLQIGAGAGRIEPRQVEAVRAFLERG